MAKCLVIVESPAKAKTIAGYLDSSYMVESSIGHVRDLPDSAKDIPADKKKEPWARLGINLDDDFKPLYLVPADKKKQVQKLKSLLKKADKLFLATDEDREGESISWHLREVLEPKVPTKRLVFHEITKSAIEAALKSTRDIDQRLVNAQETRRVLDRLYGYEISPLLWRKIAPALSAGRVQSVAVRIIVTREKERMAFNQAGYWDLEGDFKGPKGGNFKAVLHTLGERRLAAGRDFDPATGKLKAEREEVALLGEKEVRELAKRLEGVEWSVSKVEEKPFTTNSPPPFITSTLQQESNRKLRLSSQDTMRTAQALYERGYITYMRTDSTTLSEQALKAARSQIASRYGQDYLPNKPQQHRSKVKNAQEAHEAIRPAGEHFRLPEDIKSELKELEFRLYDMIWKRTIASQMLPGKGQRLVLQVSGNDAVFQATGRRIDFPGYLRAYVEGSDDPEAELGDQERLLPHLSQGEALGCAGLEAKEHVTQPPPRYSEAALIKELVKEGIGRPSTYASIIATIQRRHYVVKRGSALVPTFTAFAVVQLLERFFTHLVDLGFTAGMEDTLDAISRGERESLPYLKEFYYGTGDLPGLKELLQAEIDPRQVCTIPFGEDSKQRMINVRVGKFGPYLERGEERGSLPEGMAPDELNMEQAEAILKKGSNPDTLGNDPASGKPIYIKSGRYGPYVQLGETGDMPKMKSLLPGQNMEEMTLEDALRLLSLPRSIGKDPATGEEVLVDLGRYGPYARRGKETRTLPSAEALFTITIAEAGELFRQEKAQRFGPKPIRILGTNPDGEPSVTLMSGRYGPYVTDGETNASLPRSADPEKITLEEALKLITERAAKGPAVKKSGKKAAAKSSPAKKAVKKATSAKKAEKPAKKATLRKRGSRAGNAEKG